MFENLIKLKIRHIYNLQSSNLLVEDVRGLLFDFNDVYCYLIIVIGDDGESIKILNIHSFTQLEGFFQEEGIKKETEPNTNLFELFNKDIIKIELAIKDEQIIYGEYFVKKNVEYYGIFMLVGGISFIFYNNGDKIRYSINDLQDYEYIKHNYKWISVL